MEQAERVQHSNFHSNSRIHSHSHSRSPHNHARSHAHLHISTRKTCATRSRRRAAISFALRKIVSSSAVCSRSSPVGSLKLVSESMSACAYAQKYIADRHWPLERCFTRSGFIARREMTMDSSMMKPGCADGVWFSPCLKSDACAYNHSETGPDRRAVRHCIRQSSAIYNAHQLKRLQDSDGTKIPCSGCTTQWALLAAHSGAPRATYPTVGVQKTGFHLFQLTPESEGSK